MVGGVPLVSLDHRRCRRLPLLPCRLSASIQELFARASSSAQQPQQEQQQQQQQRQGEEAEAPADTGSPCGSSASGGWQATGPPVEAAPPAAASDADSDVLLLRAQAGATGAGKGGPDSARSADSWAVCTPPAAAEAAAGRAAAPLPVLPALRRVQAEEVPAGMRRTGSGNLEWISAVSKEWLNVRRGGWVCIAVPVCRVAPGERKRFCMAPGPAFLSHSRDGAWCAAAC